MTSDFMLGVVGREYLYPNCLPDWHKFEPEQRFAPPIDALKTTHVSNHDQNGFSHLFNLGLASAA